MSLCRRLGRVTPGVALSVGCAHGCRRALGAGPGAWAVRAGRLTLLAFCVVSWVAILQRAIASDPAGPDAGGGLGWVLLPVWDLIALSDYFRGAASFQLRTSALHSLPRYISARTARFYMRLL